MFRSIISIYQKTKVRGLNWFLNRCILEFRLPQTHLGKILKPINQKLYLLFSIIFFLKKKQFMKDTLCLFYDFEVSPITFDFCWALCLADWQRKKQKLKFIKVIFVSGPTDGLRQETSDYEAVVNKDSRRWRLYHLLYPLTRLLPSCTGFIACATREEAEWIQRNIRSSQVYPKKYHTMFPVSHHAKKLFQMTSSDVMSLRSTNQARLFLQQWLNSRAIKRKVVTITFREYPYMTKRNSNIDAWVNFANALNSSEYFVVIVPDVEHAMAKPSTKFEKFGYFPEACWNIELRSALYESSYLNLGVNNGPFALCWLNEKCRYIMFKLITEEVPQANEESFRKLGFTSKQTPFFATKYQKWVWKDDTEETIKEEFEKMCLMIEQGN